MSVWQYMAVLDGHARANDPDAAKSLTEREKDELAEWLQSKE